MSFLISPQEALNKLIKSEIYTPENAPSLNKIESILEDLQIRIEDWLRYSPIPTQYVDEIKTNNEGSAILRCYPVISVNKIVYTWAKQPPLPVQEINIYSVWRGNRIIEMGLANVFIRVTYVAGYDPLPKLFPQCMYQMLIKALENNSPDLNWLEEPTRDITSLSLPGGLSHSFKLGNSESRKDKLSRNIDRLLAPLDKYRRVILT